MSIHYTPLDLRTAALLLNDAAVRIEDGEGDTREVSQLLKMARHAIGSDAYGPRLEHAEAVCHAYGGVIALGFNSSDVERDEAWRRVAHAHRAWRSQFTKDAS